MQVVVGIDSAKFNLGVGVIDEVGRTLGVLDIGNGCEQWSQLLGWAGSFGEVSFIAVEGSGQYGAGVTTWLLEQGLQVREVPAHMTFQERKRKPSAGKTDPMDGIRIARVALREGDGLPLAGRDPLATDLKAAVEHREQLIRARTQQANRAHALLAVLRPGMLPAGLKLTTKQGLAHAVTSIRGDHQVRAEIVREHVAEIRRLSGHITKMDQLLMRLVDESGTGLTKQVGIGTVIAAKILAETKGLGRLRSSAGLAMLAGCAPIPASSGQITRHRLNRGGNRRLNHAIHMVAVNRLRLDEESKAYYLRKITEGKSRKDALRSLKRQVVNRVFNCLDADAKAAMAATSMAS